jgi:anti-sigma-K factor RskA
MSDDRLLELLPGYALGVLDAEDRDYVQSHLPRDADAQTQLAAFEEVVGRLGFLAAPVEPSSALRARVLRAVGPSTPTSAVRATVKPAARTHAATWLALAAALVCAVGLLVTRMQRDQARRETAAAMARAETAEAQVRETLAELEQTRVHLARELALRGLLGRPDTRLVSLGGLPAAPSARARVAFDSTTREAMLLASGLSRAPEGKAYQVWVIAPGIAPVPAGVFQTDADGRALFRLPDVAEVTKVKTFAVTVEPAAGVPAPTGAMVLAGTVS